MRLTRVERFLTFLAYVVAGVIVLAYVVVASLISYWIWDDPWLAFLTFLYLGGIGPYLAAFALGKYERWFDS